MSAPQDGQPRVLPQYLTRQRIATMVALHEADKPLCTADLSRITELSWDTINAHLKVFERAGWAEYHSGRERSHGTPRRVELTPEGRAYIKQLMREIN